jgi:hypothetical protein
MGRFLVLLDVLEDYYYHAGVSGGIRPASCVARGSERQ